MSQSKLGYIGVSDSTWSSGFFYCGRPSEYIITWEGGLFPSKGVNAT